MNPYEEQMDRIQQMLVIECDVPNDLDDDSEGESDHLEEDEQVADSDCYESDSPHEFLEPQQKKFDRDGWLGRDMKTWWDKKMHFPAKMHHAFNGAKGPKGPAINATQPIEFWSLFITQEMMDLLVEKTNSVICEKRVTYIQKNKAKDTDSVEMKAFLGLLLLAGLFQRMNLDDLWSGDGMGVEVFRATMSLHRFRFLLACLRFDDKSTSAERKLLDKMAPIRDFFDMFVDNCRSNYSPSEFLTVDEILIPFRGKCPFRQHTPNKLVKYGIKMHTMADARSHYVYKMEIHIGKQHEGPYNVDNSASVVVTRLVSDVSGTGRNITLRNFYTSYSLIQKLLKDYNLTAVGTLRKERLEIPQEFLQISTRPLYHSMFGFGDKVTLVSYIPSTKQKKNVIILSTVHHNDKTDPRSGDEKKPKTLSFYDSTKGGVEIADQMARKYDTSRNSRRWPLAIFYTLLNISTVNSYVLYCHNPQNNLKRYSFIKNTGMKLIEDLLKRRLQNRKLQRNLRDGIRRILPEATTTSQISPKNKKAPTGTKRCSLCDRSRDRKVKTVCHCCGRHVCGEHSKVHVLCTECEVYSSGDESE